jgi:hypothetical protein
MSKFFFILLLLSSQAFADEWRDADSYREVGYMIPHALDWAQTHTIAANPDKYFEYNPVLGSHPKSENINTYFAATALAHYGISRYVIPHAWRAAFQTVTIIIETRSVVRNLSIGINVQF